jgi:argininosuccinate lyase
MKLWGGRFEKPPSEVFERFSGSLHYDYRLFDADIRGSRAWAAELERLGVLTAGERDQLQRALDQLAAEGPDPQAPDEDVHTQVIRRLKEKAGAAADKIHTGRSRNDQVALDLRLWIRDTIRRLEVRLADLQDALLDLAGRDTAAVLPGYTHLRRAQPVLWVHYLLAWFEMFGRDVERLEQAWRAADLLPLGSGALAGSGFPIDRRRLAGELGFSGVTANSLDTAGDRDFALDFLYAASVTMLHLSRLAEDWILYSSDEFGFLELADEVTSGSSIMPQKKNPDSLELVRGKAGRVAGCLHALMMTLKGLPLTYNRDLQEDKEAVFEAADQLEGALEMARAVVAGACLKRERAAAAADESWASATELADALARKGVPFHQAHQIVGRLVLESTRTGRRPGDWTGDALAAFDPAFDPEMAELLPAVRAVENHDVEGGTAPARVTEALDAARRRLDELRSRLS